MPLPVALHTLRIRMVPVAMMAWLAHAPTASVMRPFGDTGTKRATACARSMRRSCSRLHRPCGLHDHRTIRAEQWPTAHTGRQIHFGGPSISDRQMHWSADISGLQCRTAQTFDQHCIGDLVHEPASRQQPVSNAPTWSGPSVAALMLLIYALLQHRG
jgi:hypothetical protein